MANQDFEGDYGAAGGSGERAESKEKTTTVEGVARDVFAGVSDAAREAGAKVKETVSETTAAVTDHFKEMLDREISDHISALGMLAGSINRAADDIDDKTPLAASFVRSLSAKVEQFAETYEDETVEQLIWSASEFTRRQPALVFGIAAFAGFLIFRTVKNAPARELSPSIQPTHTGSPV